jgi:hypothetical protein
MIKYAQIDNNCAYFIMGWAMHEIEVKKEFKKSKVLTIEQLVDILESSAITVRRYLKKWKAHTSFNHNGRYYTLPGIAQFDSNGIWKYQTILFSKYGNLKQTIFELIRGSEAGLSGRDIAQVLDLPSNSSIFPQLQNVAGIRREKHQGRFVYFSDEHSEKQKFALYRLDAAAMLPSDEEAVLILVQYIKHPHISVEELSETVARQGKMIAPSVIRSLLEHHELLKKIPDTRR